MNTNKPAYCVEYFYAKTEHIEDLKTALASLVEPSRQEAQCLQYDLLQDKENPSLFIIIVKFETEDAMQIHESQTYVKDFAENKMEKYCEKFFWNDASLI